MPGRRRADAISPALSPEVLADSDRLRQWHRQQASRIELDLQQHALTAAQCERDLASADRVHYATLYEQAPAGYLSLDTGGRITRGNQVAAELLGQRRDELAGMLLEGHVSAPARSRLRHFLATVFESGVRAVLELTLAPAGPGRHARRVRIEANLDSVAQQCRVILSDMGSAGRREQVRQRALQVLDNIGEGVLVCDHAQHIVAVNPAFTRLTGYLAEDVLGRDPGFLSGGGSGASYHAALQTVRHGGCWQGEPEGRRRDGSRYIAALSLTAIYDDDGGVAYYIGVFSDITGRRQAEAALRELSSELDARVVARTAELAESNRLLELSREQLGQLAAHQETVREEERGRIARDVHDELGQNLLALRLDMVQLQQRAGPAQGALRKRVAASLENLDSTIRSVRGIMNELRPAVLDLGLHGALEWQVEQFRRRSGVACTLRMPPEARMPPLPASMALALFRNLQEALVNVRRHAQADAVDVALTLKRRVLTLNVVDNGVGIDLASRTRSGAFGLIAMEQRMAAHGGRLQLDNRADDGGCRLTLSFDL